MAKVAGFLTSLTVEDQGGTARDITNATTDISISESVNQQDTSGLDVTAMERLNLREDMTITLNGVVDTASNNQHDVFKTAARSASSEREIVATTVAGPVYTVTVLFSSYVVTPGTDGSLKWSATGAISSGVMGAWT